MSAVVWAGQAWWRLEGDAPHELLQFGLQHVPVDWRFHDRVKTAAARTDYILL